MRSSYRIWPELPQEIADGIAGYISQNDLACSFRLVNKAAARQFSRPQHTRVDATLPVPPLAFAQYWGAPIILRTTTPKQRNKLIFATAKTGCITNLRFLLEHDICVLTIGVMAAAAGAGDLVMCKWIHERNPGLLDKVVLRAAARAGHLEVCAWLLSVGCPMGSRAEALGAAAAANQRPACELLIAHGSPWHGSVLYAALENGHLALAEWLLQLYPDSPAEWPYILSAAADGCDLAALRIWHDRVGPDAAVLELTDEELCSMLVMAASSRTPDWRAKVEWLEGRGYPVDNEWLLERVANLADARERLVWLWNRGYELGIGSLRPQVLSGDVATMQHFLDLGLSPEGLRDGWLAAIAAQQGHVGMLEFLRTHGCRIGTQAFKGAVYSGKLPVVMWVLEAIGSPAPLLDAGIFELAAISGSWELMEWLWQRGCAFSERAFTLAARHLTPEQLECLAGIGCPMEANGEPFAMAARNADPVTLACLRRLGCPWTPSRAARACVLGLAPTSAEPNYDPVSGTDGPPLPLFRWLHDHGYSVDWQAVRQVVGRMPGLAHPHRAQELERRQCQAKWVEAQVPKEVAAAAVMATAAPALAIAAASVSPAAASVSPAGPGREGALASPGRGAQLPPLCLCCWPSQPLEFGNEHVTSSGSGQQPFISGQSVRVP